MIQAATLPTLRRLQEGRNTSIPSGLELEIRVAEALDGAGPATITEGRDPVCEFHVGLVGRIFPWKGQPVIIKAAALVHRDFPMPDFLSSERSCSGKIGMRKKFGHYLFQVCISKAL